MNCLCSTVLSLACFDAYMSWHTSLSLRAHGVFLASVFYCSYDPEGVLNDRKRLRKRDTVCTLYKFTFMQSFVFAYAQVCQIARINLAKPSLVPSRKQREEKTNTKENKENC